MQKLPNKLSFGSSLLTTLEKNKDDERREFQMEAYTGRIVNVGHGDMVIDLSGLAAPDRGVPIYRQHNPNLFVGRSLEIENDGSVLSVKGYLFDSADGNEVANLSDQGAQWQSSIGITIDSDAVEWLSKGEEQAVNGLKIKGPLAILRKTVLNEVSFVPLGADNKTTAVALEDAEMETLLEVQEMSSENKVDALAGERKRIDELSEQFKDDERFTLEAIKQGWSVIEAKANYGERLVGRLEAQEVEFAAKLVSIKEENDLKIANLEAMLQKANRANPAAALKGGSSAGSTTPVMAWHNLIAAEVERLDQTGHSGLRRSGGLKLSNKANCRALAIQNVATKHPAAHRAFLEAQNMEDK